MQVVDPAAAALIGAGTGSAVAVGSQFLSHWLATKRDRRNQRRDRLYRVIVQAAAGLYGPSKDERPSVAEVLEGAHPESVSVEDPELTRDLSPIMLTTSEGIALLQIHFGHGHPLVRSYVDTAGECLGVQRRWSEHKRRDSDDEKLREVPEMMEAMAGAHHARDRWMREARAEVEQL